MHPVPYLARHPAPMAELRGRYPTASTPLLRHVWLLPALWSVSWWTFLGALTLIIGGGLGDLPVVVEAAVGPSVIATLTFLGALWCTVVTRNLTNHHRALRHLR